MLSSVSLRICWVAAMAPALTEAANQADNFSLTCTTDPTDIEFSVSLDFISKGNNKFKNYSFMTLGQLASSCKAKSFESSLSKLEEQLVETSAELVPTVLQWNDTNELLQISETVEHLKSLQHENHTNSLNSKLPETESLQGVKEGPCNLNVHKHTMSKNITHFQDTMGLLNANTSLDSELKSKLSDDCKQSAFSSHEQMLLFSDPGKQERCSDIDLPLEVDDEKLQTEVGEALLKKLVSVNPPIMQIKNPPSHNESGFQWTALPKIENPETQIELMETCYASLKSRSANIVRRIRKLQLKQTESHTSEQLKYLKDNRRKLLDVPSNKRTQPRVPSQLRLKKAEELLHSKEIKTLTTTALVDLVKEIESGQTLKDEPDEVTLEQEVKPVEVVKELNCNQDIHRTASSLRGIIHHIERSVVDSDVTESSSGGESGDEAPNFTSVQRGKSNSLHKRSYWRWTIDRAAVATRWVWLQAQISDLEYKIRQQNEVYRQFRLAKGSVTLMDTTLRKHLDSEVTKSPTPKLNNNQLAGVDSPNLNSEITGASSSTNRLENSILASRLHKNANGFWPLEKTGNGYISKVSESSPGGTQEKSTEDPEQTVNGTGGDCSRTRPLKCIKRRKLVRTLGLHYFNRKVSKLASVRCQCNCQRDYMPCIICGGRYNSTQSVDSDIMSFSERVGLLDPSFHPRLSFKHETQTGIQYENLLRKSKYQRSRITFGGMRRKWGNLPSYSISNQARKRSRKLTKNAAQTLLLSSKTRRASVDGSTTKRKRILREKKTDENGAKKIVVESAETDTSSCRKVSERHRSCSLSSSGSKPCSPSPSPVPPNGDAAEFLQPSSGKIGAAAADCRRRRLDDAYDINNIVIPYSIASATRLEKLQYKEILTPKWRLVEESPCVENPVEEEVEEDISDELYAVRHLKCEEDERKKFLSYISVPGRSRSRSTRMDSRADSSGANTPDPMSPAQSDFLIQESLSGWSSPVASPPPPPSTGWQLEFESSLLQPASISTRRRTISLTKRTSEDERQHSFTPVSLFGDVVQPYDVRNFPLPEEEINTMVKASSHLDESGKQPVDYSYPATPVEVSSNGSPQAEDDPNDPEWVTSSVA